MALQLGALRDALEDAGAKPEKAARAVEELAGYEGRFAGTESRLAAIDGGLSGIDARLALLTWAVGINAALTLAVLAKLIVQH
jgi:hypothetical protein